MDEMRARAPRSEGVSENLPRCRDYLDCLRLVGCRASARSLVVRVVCRGLLPLVARRSRSLVITPFSTAPRRRSVRQYVLTTECTTHQRKVICPTSGSSLLTTIAATRVQCLQQVLRQYDRPLCRACRSPFCRPCASIYVRARSATAKRTMGAHSNGCRSNGPLQSLLRLMQEPADSFDALLQALFQGRLHAI